MELLIWGMGEKKKRKRKGSRSEKNWILFAVQIRVLVFAGCSVIINFINAGYIAVVVNKAINTKSTRESSPPPEAKVSELDQQSHIE